MFEREVNNVPELLDAASEFSRSSASPTIWYRGHGSVDWKLISHVHRKYSNIGERELTARFLLAAPMRSNRTHSLKDLPGWLSLMQHYGLPTRLLDWTSSLLAAAYFAVCYDPKPGPCVVWALDPARLNAVFTGDASIFLLMGPQAHDLLIPAFEGGPNANRFLGIYGQDVDLRMTVQQGAFTIHGSPTPLETVTDADHFLAKMIIPESSKPEFDQQIWMLGVRRSSLFPDLANLATDLATDHRTIPLGM